MRRPALLTAMCVASVPAFFLSCDFSRNRPDRVSTLGGFPQSEPASGGKASCTPSASEKSPEKATGAEKKAGPAQKSAAAPLPAAPRKKRRSPPPTPFEKNCLLAGCHDDLKQSPAVHGPVAVGACDTCHEPSPPGHRFKRVRPEPDLCTRCHREVMEKEFMHTAVAEDSCLVCHRPHGGTDKFFLTAKSPEELCADCHTPEKGTFVHGPVAVGACGVCHDPHQGNEENLLRKQGTALCTDCHTDTAQTLAEKKHVHKPAQEDCTTCHTSHASDRRFLLRKPIGELCLQCHKHIRAQVTNLPIVHGAVRELRQCANCHTPHAADLSFQLRAPALTLCLRCHNKEITAADGKKLTDMAKVIGGSKNAHGPIREGSCVPCHNTHGSVNFRLLMKTFPKKFYAAFDLKNYDLCFSCHQKSIVLTEETAELTGFRDGRRNLHYVHVHKERKGRTCRACHEVHASDLPKHIRKSVPFGSIGWPLPINFKKTEAGGFCAPGCHKPMGYSRSPETASAEQTSKRR